MPASPSAPPDLEKSVEEPILLPGLLAFNRVLGHIELAIVAVLVVTLVSFSVYSFGSRLVTDHAATWIGHWIQACVYLLGFFTGVLAAQSDRMISMDIIAQRSSAKTRAYLKLLTRVFVIVVGITLTLAGARYFQIENNRLSVAVVVCGGLITLHTLIFLVQELAYFAARRMPPSAQPRVGH